MTKRQKRLERLRQNPKNVKFDELLQILEDYGFYLDRVVGSHYSFKRAEHDTIFVCPFRRPTVKTIYVKKALALIDDIIEAESLSETEDGDEPAE